MRSLKIILYSCIAFALIALNQGCTKDCSKIVCGYNQICTEAKCYCINGLEGDSCNKPSYRKYTNKTWLVTQDGCSLGTSAVTFQLAGTTLDHLVVSGIGSSSYIDVYIKSSVDHLGNYLAISPDGQQVNGTTTITGHGEYTTVTSGAGTGTTYITFYLTKNQNGVETECILKLY